MFYEWLEHFLQNLRLWEGDLTPEKIISAALASGFALALIKLSVKLTRWTNNHISSFVQSKRRLDNVLRAVDETGKGVWLSKKPVFPENYKAHMTLSQSIMTVANLKGGVGKTTIAANVAAHHAYQGQRVLLIDLDYQGSLSSMILNGGIPAPSEHNAVSKAARLVGSPDPKDIILHEAEPLNLQWRPPHWPHSRHPQIHGIPAFYDLARTDNRVMLEWLLDCYKGCSDPRYWLAEALHHPLVRAQYDQVIIDAPPRMVTGCVQALCASTHVLIPTILDQVSADAVDRFVTQLEVEQELWPHLKVAGVVATMCHTPITQYETRVIRFLLDRLQRHRLEPQLLWKDTFISRSGLLSRESGEGIAYAANHNAQGYREMRDKFGALADAIKRSLEGERTHETWESWLRAGQNGGATPTPESQRVGSAHRQPEQAL